MQHKINIKNVENLSDNWYVLKKQQYFGCGSLLIHDTIWSS
jgi:hypothetical protein